MVQLYKILALLKLLFSDWLLRFQLAALPHIAGYV
jgi:hypothetical protein